MPEPWNYDRTKIGAEGRDKARYELGDTGVIRNQANETVWLLYDEEIDAMIGSDESGVPSKYPLGVAELAEGLATRFAQSSDVYTGPGGDRVEWKSRVSQWNTVAKRMRERLTPVEVAPVDPGLTVVAGMTDPTGISDLTAYGRTYVRYN